MFKKTDQKYSPKFFCYNQVKFVFYWDISEKKKNIDSVKIERISCYGKACM